jgi:hypothetical protein
MKFFTLSICFTLFSNLYLLSAQNLKVVEPEFVGAIVLVNQDDCTSQKLEKQTASSAAKADIGAALFGVAKGKSINKVNGASSPTRTKNGKIVRLIVKMKENSRDPAEVINVFKMDEGKDNRLLIVGKLVFNQTSQLDIKYLPFQGSKFGTSSYLIQLSNVEPGEYAVTIDGTRMIFNLFGVDLK